MTLLLWPGWYRTNILIYSIEVRASHKDVQDTKYFQKEKYVIITKGGAPALQ